MKLLKYTPKLGAVRYSCLLEHCSDIRKETIPIYLIAVRVHGCLVGGIVLAA